MTLSLQILTFEILPQILKNFYQREILHQTHWNLFLIYLFYAGTISSRWPITYPVTTLCSLKNSRNKVASGSWNPLVNHKVKVFSCSTNCSKSLNGKMISAGNLNLLKQSPTSCRSILWIPYWLEARNLTCVFTFLSPLTNHSKCTWPALASPGSPIKNTLTKLTKFRTPLCIWQMSPFRRLQTTTMRDWVESGTFALLNCFW